MADRIRRERIRRPSRAVSAAVLALAGLVVLPGAGEPPGLSVAHGYLPPRHGGRLTVPLSEAPVTLDPARARRDAELSICSLLYDTLFVLADRRPRPRLAAGMPEVAADRLTVTLRLRPGVLLHDGRTLGAAAVAGSLSRLRGAANGYLLASVAGVRAEADGRTLIFTLHRPTPELALLLSAPATAVVVPAGKRLVGSGAYRLVSRKPDRLLLKANQAHFAGRPYLDELVLRVFARASAEVASFQVGALQLSRHGASVFGSPKYPSATLDTAAVSTVFLATGRRPSYLAEPLFRAALRAAIDRKRLQRLAGSGRALVAHGPVSPRLLRYRRRRSGFDRKLANRLLARLARRDGALRAAAAAGRVRLKLLVDASRADDRTLAGQIVADLDRIGIEAQLEATPASDYQARFDSGRYQLALGRVAVQVPRGAVALADALAAAGDGAAARRCVAARRCGVAEARRLVKQLRLLPLVHPAVKLHYDARLGGLGPRPDGRVDLQRIYWRRKR